MENYAFEQLKSYLMFKAKILLEITLAQSRDLYAHKLQLLLFLMKETWFNNSTANMGKTPAKKLMHIKCDSIYSVIPYKLAMSWCTEAQVIQTWCACITMVINTGKLGSGHTIFARSEPHLAVCYAVLKVKYFRFCKRYFKNSKSIILFILRPILCFKFTIIRRIRLGTSWRSFFSLR